MSSAIAIPEKTQTPPPGNVPYRLSSDEFFRMIEAEVFDRDRRVYLWDGRLYEATAKTLPHAVTSANILAAFFQSRPPGWCIWPENPIAIDETRAPLPAVIIIRGKPDDYARRGQRPEPADVGLIVEIVASNMRTDTGAKLEAYARALLPVYWVVNLNTRRIMACSEPRIEDGLGIYGQVTTYGQGDLIPLTLDGREIAQIPVEDLLAPEPKA